MYAPSFLAYSHLVAVEHVLTTPLVTLPKYPPLCRSALWNSNLRGSPLFSILFREVATAKKLETSFLLMLQGLRMTAYWNYLWSTVVARRLNLLSVLLAAARLRSRDLSIHYFYCRRKIFLGRMLLWPSTKKPNPSSMSLLLFSKRHWWDDSVFIIKTCRLPFYQRKVGIRGELERD